MRKRWAVVIRNVADIEIGRSTHFTRRGAQRRCDQVNRDANNSVLAQVARQIVSHPMPPPWYAGVQRIQG